MLPNLAKPRTHLYNYFSRAARGGECEGGGAAVNLFDNRISQEVQYVRRNRAGLLGVGTGSSFYKYFQTNYLLLCNNIRKVAAQCQCALLAGSLEELIMNSGAVHGAVPRAVEPLVTDHLDNTPAMVLVVAGEEAGPGGDGLTAEDSLCSVCCCIFYFFFICLRLVSVPTAGRFFFFFLQHKEIRGFLGFVK
jgi:hypothetical protein